MSYVANKFIEAKLRAMKKRSDRYMKKGRSGKVEKIDARVEKFGKRAEAYLIFEAKVGELLDKANFLFDKEHQKKTSLQIRDNDYKHPLKNKASIELKTAEVLLGAAAFVPALALYGAVEGIDRVVDYKREKPIVDEFVKVIESADEVVEVKEDRINESLMPAGAKKKSAYRIKDDVLLVRYATNEGEDRFAIIQNGFKEVAIVASKTGVNKIIRVRNKKIRETNEKHRKLQQAEKVADLQKLYKSR